LKNTGHGRFPQDYWLSIRYSIRSRKILMGNDRIWRIFRWNPETGYKYRLRSLFSA
jgi:hypothetical protein